MESRISATRAARTLSDLLNRVRYRGESFVIMRSGEAVGRLVPAGPPPCTLADLVRTLRSAAAPDAGYVETLRELMREQPRLPEGPWER